MYKKYLHFFVFLVTMTVIPSFAFAQELLGTNCKETGSETPGADDLKIKYMGNSSLPYGRSASASARPFQGIVFHWPGQKDCNINAAVNYGLSVDSSRGSSQFGYTFYIDLSGNIAQGAPINKRTNHITGGRGLSNSNSMGITLICSDRQSSATQLEAAKKLGQAVQVAYNISSGNIYGHGELQADRSRYEGLQAANALRSTVPSKSSLKVFYEIGGGKKVTCEINGQIPSGCTGSYCNNVAGNAPPYGSFSPASSFAQPYGSKYLNDANAWRYPFQQQAPNGQLYYPSQQPQQTPGTNPLSNLLQNTQPQTQTNATSSNNSILNSNGNTTADCSQSGIASYRAKLLYYLNLYNKNYQSSYGSWSSFLQKQNSIPFSIDSFIAKVYANQILTYTKLFSSCINL